ncbi:MULTISPECIES: hypothetical protein [Vibrio]|uniref:hypothetical protein n=1 Tax=Vibrio TaxID=662 RepID=UPI0020756DF5|nr:MULTISPECIES: hypothetical protein [Vibrio]USD33785.1 hypothetical protein J8Z27_06750 [Vibrio sp. SCSIO 43186]USD46885.1 hypothetical protein J4N38_07135 [Vibrio sp. SCSIO 43145]USD70909.1 hypothetical protein J4N41_06755 [Vibrio sp. SCSIO 43139]
MSIPNHQLKTDNQRLAGLYLVGYRVYGGLFEFYGIVGSRLARALADRKAKNLSLHHGC